MWIRTRTSTYTSLVLGGSARARKVRDTWYSHAPGEKVADCSLLPACILLIGATAAQASTHILLPVLLYLGPHQTPLSNITIYAFTVRARLNGTTDSRNTRAEPHDRPPAPRAPPRCPLGLESGWDSETKQRVLHEPMYKMVL